MVVWIIGLSGAGKTTVGNALREQILETGRCCVLVDGDVIRNIFDNDLSHSLADRKKNATRICKLCAYLSSQGVNVVCAILSLFHESQEWNRENIPDYYEVFLEASLEQVISRDVKGIYKKAQSGEISEVVGIDIKFPPPKCPNLTIQNDFSVSPKTLAKQIFSNIDHILK